MCGIAGIFDIRGERPVDEGLLARMTDSLVHRGPDDSGLHVEPGLGLGHRRLAIIDLASGQQPMTSAGGNAVITFNGEIYNFAELRTELRSLGHSFRTASDTEVLLNAWHEWGQDCVSRLNGMFAFALWDRGRRELFLARDPIGIKPLYYSLLEDGWMIFGSELKSLQQHPQLRRGIDVRAVEDYFTFGYVPDPGTILVGSYKLPAAHWMLWRRNGMAAEPRRYWDVQFSRCATGSEHELKSELLSRISDAVKAQMVSEVPLGAFLSGGVDSSVVVATMAAISAEPIRTCSIGFSEPAYDESSYADRVAGQFHTRHISRKVEPGDFGLIDSLIDLYDEPFADSSAIPTYRVCELARQNVTVALSGDGGDETFAGYRRYQWHMREDRIRAFLPERMRRLVFGPLGRSFPKLDWAPQIFRAKTTFQALAMTSAQAYLHSVSIFPEHLRRKLFSKATRSELQGYESSEVFRRHAVNGPDDPLSLVQYLDYHTYLPGDILTKVDRASMAHSLEVRVPLLDHELVSWAASLDPGLKLRKSEGKYLLKRSFEGRLPHDVLYRRKMGFAVPLEEWFRGPLKKQIRDVVPGDRLAETGLFDMAFLDYLVRQHQSGLQNFAPVLWAMLMFDGFCRRNEIGGS